MDHQWDFSFLLDQWPFVLRGLLATFQLTAVCLTAGVVLGLAFASARLSRLAALRLLGTAYVEFFRNIPVLVQIFWCYFALPILAGIQPNAFTAACLGISLYAGAYLTEIFRSGIQSIERGQWDGARAIGFGHLRIMALVVLPLAFRRILPAFTNQVLEIVKTTTVASTIAYGEVLYAAKLLSEQEFRPIEAYTLVGAFFITLLMLVSLASGLLERRLRLHG